MLRRIFFSYILSFTCLITKAQVNLVSNFSFEQHDTCPNLEDQIQYAIGWSKYSSDFSPANTTPDYFNACSPDSLFGVPKSFWVYQPEHRSCNAYTGVITYYTAYPNYREHIGIQLTQSLIIGQKYFISFYTVMGEFKDSQYQFGFPSNNIGIRLSTTSYNGNNPVPVDNFAHLRSVSVISDSTNWQRISGSIIADSAFNYLVIGNFFDDMNTDTMNYNCGWCWPAGSYYLVDDICLSTDSLLCNGGIDLLPCNTSVNATIFDNGIKIFPNPVTNLLNISFTKSASADIVIYNIFSQKIYSGKVENTRDVILDLSLFNAGTYFIKIINENNNYAILTRKLIKL